MGVRDRRKVDATRWSDGPSEVGVEVKRGAREQRPAVKQAGAGAGAPQAQARKAARALQFSPARVLAGPDGLEQSPRRPARCQRVWLNRRPARQPLALCTWHAGGTMGPGPLNLDPQPVAGLWV